MTNLIICNIIFSYSAPSEDDELDEERAAGILQAHLYIPLPIEILVEPGLEAAHPAPLPPDPLLSPRGREGDGPNTRRRHREEEEEELDEDEQQVHMV